MKKVLLILLIIPLNSFSQNDVSEPVPETKKVSIKSGANLIRIIADRIPGARLTGDGIVIRGSLKTSELRGAMGGNNNTMSSSSKSMMWDVDGMLYNSPPPMDLSQILYLNALKGLAETNKYGQQGASGVIVIRTQETAKELINNSNNLWNVPTPLTKEERKILKAAKKAVKAKQKSIKAERKSKRLTKKVIQ